MAIRVQANEQGDIVIPGGTFGVIEPNASYTIIRIRKRLYVVPTEEEAGLLEAERMHEKQEKYWAETTPEQRVKDFLEWANQPRPETPILPDEAFRRENMYD